MKRRGTLSPVPPAKGLRPFGNPFGVGYGKPQPAGCGVAYRGRGKTDYERMPLHPPVETFGREGREVGGGRCPRAPCQRA